MAGEKVLRADEIGVENVGFAIAVGEEKFGGRDKENMAMNGRALGGKSASEKGPQKGV
jgi:hypothetical protein